MPIVENLYSVCSRRTIGWIWSEQVPNEILDLLWNLVLCFLGVLRESINSSSDSDSISIEEWVCKIRESVKDTSKHPEINLAAHLQLQVRIYHFRRTIHGRSHSLHLLLQMCILTLMYGSEVYSTWGAWAEITELETSIFSNYYIFYLHILVVGARLMQGTQPL